MNSIDADKMMKTTFRVIFSLWIPIFVLVFGIPASAQAKSQVLTLDDCLDIVLENNPDLRSAELSAKTAEFDYQSALSIFDPILSIDLLESVTSTTGSDSNSLSGAFNIKKNVFTGGQWDFKYTTSRNRMPELYPTGALYQNQFDLAYSHPLLEGADNRVVKSGLEIAKISADIEWLQIDNVKRNLILQVKNNWYDALKAQNTIEVAELSLKEAKTLLETIQAQFDAGYKSAYEVTASESGLASREELLLLSKTDYLNQMDTLKNYLGMSLDTQIEVSGSLETEMIDIPDHSDVFEKAKANRPDLMQLEDTIRLAKINLHLAEDSKKATLFAIGQFGLNGQDFGFGKSIGNVDDTTNWYLGLNYSVPLGGNKSARAGYEQSKLRLEIAELQYQDSISDLELEVTLAIRNLVTAEERIGVTSKGVEFQKEKLESDKARYELGLITSGVLLDYEEDLATARLRDLESKADYLKVISYLEYVTNSVLN